MQLVDTFAGQRRDLQDGRIADEIELALQLGHHLQSLLGIVDQLPLVEHHHDRAAGGVDALGQSLILAGDAVGRVDHQQGDVGPVDGAQGADHRVVLGRVVDPAAAAHARGVDEHDGSIGGFDQCVDGVTRGAGHVVHDRSILTHEPVEEGALADVGPTHDSDTRWRCIACLPQLRRIFEIDADRGILVVVHRWKQRDDLVEQIAGTAAVECADRIGITGTEGQELPPVVLAPLVVGLVGHQQDRRFDPPQPVGQRLVVLGDTRCRVDEEQHHIGSLHSSFDLAADLDIEIVAARQPPTGVDQQEVHAEPVGLCLLAITGHAGAVFDNRNLLADDPVEQGALADVGTPDDDNGGQRHDAGSRALRREMPSVATTSTDRGNSSTVVPSRNRPSDRHTSGSRYRWPTGSWASTRCKS